MLYQTKSRSLWLVTMLALTLSLSSCNAWSTGASSSNRRAWLKEAVGTIAVGVSFVPAVAGAQEDDDNEFVQMLKKRSLEKKNEYAKEATRTNKLSTSSFGKQYERPSFVGVRKAQNDNSSVTMVSKDIFDEMMAKNEIIVYDFQMAKKKDGTDFEDYTSKIYVFANNDALAYAKSGQRPSAANPPVVTESTAEESAATTSDTDAP